MAAWSREPDLWKKVALVLGGGLVVSGTAYALWWSFNKKESPEVEYVEIEATEPGIEPVQPVSIDTVDDVVSKDHVSPAIEPEVPSRQVPLIKSGYVIKLESQGKSWEKRYFVLDEESVLYYKTKEDITPIEIVNHEDITEANISAGLDRENVFEVVMKSGIFYCQAATPEERDTWIAAINTCLGTQPVAEAAAAAVPEEPVVEAKEKDSKILMLGLNGAGKSSILAKMSHQEHDPQLPSTDGFNVMCVQTEEVSLNIWESNLHHRFDLTVEHVVKITYIKRPPYLKRSNIVLKSVTAHHRFDFGGKPAMRQYWPNFVADADVIVYVMDAADYSRMSESAAELQKLLKIDRVKSLPLVIIAHKQDRRSAISARDLKGFLQAEVLSTLSIKNKEIHYLGTEALSDSSHDSDSPIRQLRNLLVHLTT